MLLRPEGPSRTPQTMYPNIGGRPRSVHTHPQGRDNITTDTKSWKWVFEESVSGVTVFFFFNR